MALPMKASKQKNLKPILQDTNRNTKTKLTHPLQTTGKFQLNALHTCLSRASHTLTYRICMALRQLHDRKIVLIYPLDVTNLIFTKQLWKRFTTIGLKIT